MKLTRRNFVGGSAALGGTIFALGARATPTTQKLASAPATPLSPVRTQAPGIIDEALSALDRHSARIACRDRLGIADYTAHSREYRFHLVDVAGGKISRSFLVSHGRGSDAGNTGFARRFSNVPGSNASSRGSFATGEEYIGKHGRSRRLHGLEAQNDRAFERAIVIHGADYVDRRMARNQGRVGRSLGCFAFEQSEIDTVIDMLGTGRLLYTVGNSA